jgi:hypothetical protein
MCGLRDMNGDVVLAAQFLDGLSSLGRAEGLAVPSVLVRHERDARAFHGLRDDAGGFLVLGERFRIGRINGGDVVAVDLDGMPPEGAGAGGVDGCIPPEFRRSPLAQAVHVQNGDHVAQLVVAGLVEGFPDGAFGQAVVVRVAWMVPVVLEGLDQEHRHQIGGRHRGRRVARFGRRRAPDAVHPELPPQLRDALQFTGHEDTPSYRRVARLTRVPIHDLVQQTGRVLPPERIPSGVMSWLRLC